MPGCVRKDVLGGCTGGHVYESHGMIKDHSVCVNLWPRVVSV